MLKGFAMDGEKDLESRRLFLITHLLEERGETMDVPREIDAQRRLLRALMNVRPPMPATQEFIDVQDSYLSQVNEAKGRIELETLDQLEDGIYLWRGDITTLAVDAIVNAANSKMLGCFAPCHGCIDNAIHTYAGVQLRLECYEIMQRQGHDEPTGTAKITGAYNLPSKHVMHTVGPIVYGDLTDDDRAMLQSCYKSCLDLACEQKLHSIAFCCISTGEFHFPNHEAANIAVDTVREFLQSNRSGGASDMKVVFNVFKQLDYDIYRGLLG